MALMRYCRLSSSGGTHSAWRSRLLAALPLVLGVSSGGPATPRRYYGHAVVEDSHGVIAPWYGGQNGPCDSRVRVAAETLKRYP